jgi:hypothetical protein
MVIMKRKKKNKKLIMNPKEQQAFVAPMEKHKSKVFEIKVFGGGDRLPVIWGACYRECEL